MAPCPSHLFFSWLTAKRSASRYERHRRRRDGFVPPAQGHRCNEQSLPKSEEISISPTVSSAQRSSPHSPSESTPPRFKELNATCPPLRWLTEGQAMSTLMQIRCEKLLLLLFFPLLCGLLFTLPCLHRPCSENGLSAAAAVLHVCTGHLQPQCCCALEVFFFFFFPSPFSQRQDQGNYTCVRIK